ncbi:MAG: DUF2207 domain-containing protein [Candidatus Omnitrophota bacterium]|jgi:uncharacterized membrane protein YgcG
MKKNSVLLLAAGFLVNSFLILPVIAQDLTSERILSYHSDIKVNRDASMVVTETLIVGALGDRIKHGIYRDFPTKYRDHLGHWYNVEFKVKEVLKDGLPENYHFKALSNGIRVYIGDKNTDLSPKEYTYAIVYETNRQLGFFKDFDELYWNVTGNGWVFPIDKASASVELPAGVAGNSINVDGYTGPAGAKEKNFTTTTDYYGRVTFETTQALSPWEGLTIVVSWPKGFVRAPDFQQKLIYFMNDNRSVLVGLICILALLVYYLTVWVYFGRDPEKGTIIPLYGPPDKFSPASVRYLMKMGYDNKAFTAAVISMAVKGYCKIEEAAGVYTLRKTSATVASLTDEEEELARKLFLSDTLELQNKNHTIIQAAMAHLQRSLKNQFEKSYFVTNIVYFVPGLIFSIFMVLICGLFEVTEKYPIMIFMCFWLTIWSAGVGAMLQNIFALWKAVMQGGKNIGAAVGMSMFAVPFVIGELIGIGFLAYATSVTVIGVLLSAVFLNLLFYHLLKAPTFMGRKMMDRIEGFKMYLSVAEKDRLNLLNPPENTPELFEKFLPYALALDVEQLWAERFTQVLNAASADGRQYHPAWYSGTGWMHHGVGGFSDHLGSSFSNAIASSSHAPGSSSGGGGGGSSGGGGGGGGGGGW